MKQELFTTEDVAARWDKPLSYVQDLTRRGLLPMNRGMVRVTPGERMPLTINRYIERKDLEAFEQASDIRLGSWKHLKEAADFWDVSEKTLRRRAHDKKMKSRKDPSGRLLIFCPAAL
jgi:hypothetical protein